MESLIRRVSEVIEVAYPGAVVEYEVYPGDRLGGTVITDKFEHLDLSERNRELWKHFRAELGAESTQLTTFLTFTPEEVREMDQVMAA